MMSAKGWTLLFSIALATMLPGLSLTQSFNGSIGGLVTDPSGAVIPGAQLTLKSVRTGAEMKFTADRDGLFRFGNLQQDVYELRATAKGFQEFVQRGITVNVNQAVTVNITLAIGPETQTIEVTTNASPLNFETPEIKQAIPTKAVEDLPLQVQSEIDHYVAARDQILPRKWRVFDETMVRENTHRTKFWFHQVRVILLDKEPLQALSAHVFRNAPRVLALAGHL